MTKLKVEKNETGWLLLSLADDGIWDIVGQYDTRKEATNAKSKWIRSDAESRYAEQHHQAQYAYACGYYD